MLGENGALRVENEKLKARVAELEAKLGRPTKTPENSSLPPSRGQKANRPAGDDTNKRTKASHPGVGRSLSENPYPPDSIDHLAWENGWSEGRDAEFDRHD